MVKAQNAGGRDVKSDVENTLLSLHEYVRSKRMTVTSRSRFALKRVKGKRKRGKVEGKGQKWMKLVVMEGDDTMATVTKRTWESQPCGTAQLPLIIYTYTLLTIGAVWCNASRPMIGGRVEWRWEPLTARKNRPEEDNDTRHGGNVWECCVMCRLFVG